MIHSNESVPASLKIKPQSTTIKEPKDNVESIDKIREILMGSKINEQNLKMHNFQSKVESEFQNLRGEFLDRMNALEKCLKQDIKALEDRLDREAQEKDKTFKKISNTLENLRIDYDTRLESMHKTHAIELKEARSLILSTTKSLSEELHSLNQKLSLNMNQSLDLLTSSKVSRNQLAEMLGEWAARLGKADRQNG